MMKYGIQCILFLIPVITVSQADAHSNAGGTQNNFQTDMLFQNYNIDFRNKYDTKNSTTIKRVQSVYLFEKWDNELYIESIDGKALTLNTANYNIDTDRFEVSTTNDSVYIMQPGAISEIRLNDRKFDHIRKNGKYYENIYEGSSLTLLKRFGYRFKPGAVNPMTLEKLQEDKVVLTNVYFIKEGADIEPIDLNKKSILKRFEEHKKELQRFVKKNNLSYKEQEDWVKILEHIESI